MTTDEKIRYLRSLSDAEFAEVINRGAVAGAIVVPVSLVEDDYGCTSGEEDYLDEWEG